MVRGSIIEGSGGSRFGNFRFVPSLVESIQQIWLLNPSGKLFFVSFDFREVWWLISINQFDKNIVEIIAIMT